MSHAREAERGHSNLPTLIVNAIARHVSQSLTNGAFCSQGMQLTFIETATLLRV